MTSPRNSTADSVNTTSLPSSRSRMMEKSGPGDSAAVRSSAAATALSSFRPPIHPSSTARDRASLRTGSSDTMSTDSNVTCRSTASGKILSYFIHIFFSLFLCVIFFVSFNFSCRFCYITFSGKKRKIINLV